MFDVKFVRIISLIVVVVWASHLIWHWRISRELDFVDWCLTVGEVIILIYYRKVR